MVLCLAATSGSKLDEMNCTSSSLSVSSFLALASAASLASTSASASRFLTKQNTKIDSLYIKSGKSYNVCLFVYLMGFDATFNNISVISWRSVLLVKEIRGPGENQCQVTAKLYHIMLYTSPWSRFELTTSVVIGTDCIGSCKSNYHKIMATTALESHTKKIYELAKSK